MKKRIRKPKDFGNGLAFIAGDKDLKWVFITANILITQDAEDLGVWLIKASEYLRQENRRKK